MDQIVTKKGTHDGPLPMGLADKTLKKGNVVGILLQGVRRRDPHKDFSNFSSNLDEGKDGRKGQPTLPLVPP